MMEEFQPKPSYLIEDVDTLRIVADPLRIQILEVMVMQAFTAKQVADRLGLAASKLYYHINMLEKHGLLQLVETRMVANLQEKYFRATALSFNVADSLLKLAPEGGIDPVTTLIASTLDTTKDDVLRSFQAQNFVVNETGELKQKTAVFSRQLARLTAKQSAAFHSRLAALCQEFSDFEQAGSSDASDNTEANQPWALTIAYYPTIYFPEEE